MYVHPWNEIPVCSCDNQMMEIISQALDQNKKPFDQTLNQLRLIRATDIRGYEDCRLNKAHTLDHVIHYYMRRTREIQITEQETLETLRQRFGQGIIEKEPAKQEIKQQSNTEPIQEMWQCLLCQQNWSVKASCIHHIQAFHNCNNYSQIQRCMQLKPP